MYVFGSELLAFNFSYLKVTFLIKKNKLNPYELNKTFIDQKKVQNN